VNGSARTQGDFYVSTSNTATLYANTFTFRLADTASGTAGPIKVIINSNGPNAGSPQTLVMGVDGTQFSQVAYLDTQKGGVSGTTPLAFRMNGTEYMRVHTNGYVGIGVSNPPVLLSAAGTCSLGPGASTTTAAYHTGMVNIIGGGTRALLRIENNNSVGSPGIIFGEGGNFTEDTQPTIKKVQGTNNLAIMCGGNVGINVTAPGYLFDCDVNANVDGGAQMKNSSTGTAATSAWRLGNANGGNRGGIAILGSGYTTSGMYRQDGVYCYSASSGGFTLSAQGVNNIYFHTNSTERMRIDSNGYIGMNGSTSPSCALHFGTPVVNKIISLYDATGTAPTSAADFYGFGINGGTLRYQTDGSSSVHKFYGGSTLYATIGTQVQVPGKYYAAGYLNGNTTAGNVINLTTLQTQGGMTVTTSNKLVAPIAGLYHFGFQTIMQTTTGRNDVYILLNGANFVNTLNEDNGSGYHQRTASMCYYLNANDYIQFYCATGTIYGISASDDNNWRKWYFYHVG
jgi:hypothetical protein